ncbi:hypothetical protein B0H17DRAFT_1069509 [Mycena rosella]|uniref:Uncharacterized protein n=1 Tax=Mycena rosella TaxID=1033263 RepID=A0AAD7DBE2_MYCRO|nr:hypothetical protein B0H17DRAFT_1069509 [Mycena rosella]
MGDATRIAGCKPAPKPPLLPLELEKEIFEIAARLYPGMAPVLMRVAHRVLVWIEPIVYETLIFRGEDPPPSLQLALKSKPADFFPNNVRNLLLDHSEGAHHNQGLLLASCSGVRNLLLMAARPFMLPHVMNMKLQRLHVDIQNLFDSLEINFTQPFFANITHLDFWGYQGLETLSSPSGLSSLPELTHLKLYVLIRSVVCSFLSNCKKLRILIAEAFITSLKAVSLAAAIDDLRFLLMASGATTDDWIAGTRGERDPWARADIFVAKRRRGEIQPASRCWIEAADMIN